MAKTAATPARRASPPHSQLALRRLDCGGEAQPSHRFVLRLRGESALIVAELHPRTRTQLCAEFALTDVGGHRPRS